MLLRSSSTPVLGSLLSSYSETPNRDFDSTNNNNNNKHFSSDHHFNKISFSHGLSSHPSFSSFSFRTSPINPSFDRESNNSSTHPGGFRRAQSDGNLQDLLAPDTDEIHHSFKSSSKPLRRSMLHTIPSFSIYNNGNGDEEEEEEEEEERDGPLQRSVTIGDNIMAIGGSGEFSFGKNMSLLEEDGGQLHYLGGIEEEDQVEPSSPPLFLARGLGIDMFGAGGDFGFNEFGNGKRDESNMEDYYKKMVEENPSSPLFLRNYAQFLYKSKGDLRGAEEYYSRAILADPGDGDILSQYAKVVWELHHDLERASNYFERAVEVAPEDSHIHAAYASFLWETEDEEEDLRQDLIEVPFFRSGAMTSANAYITA